MTASAPLPVGQMTGQHPLAVIQDPSVDTQTQPSDQKSGNWRRLTSSGYAQIVIGLVSVLMGILAIVFKSYLYYIGHGIWAGLCLYILTGLFGVAAGARKDTTLLVTYLILSLFAGLGAIAVGLIAGHSIDRDEWDCPSSDDQNSLNFGTERFGCSSSQKGRAAISGLIIATCVAELVAAIVGASFTIVCLCKRGRSGTVVDTQTEPSDQKSRKWKRLTSSGLVQIVIGLVSVLMGILAIVFKSNLYEVGHGIWGGLCFYIVAGLFGIAAGARRNTSLTITYLILSLLAALASIGVGVAVSLSIMFDKLEICPREDRVYYAEYIERLGCSTSSESRLAISGLIMVTCVVEGMAAIIGAVFSCMPLCPPCCTKKRGNSSTMGQVRYVPVAQTNAEAHGPVQYVVLTPRLQQSDQQPGNVVYMGQPVAVPNQPQFQPVLQHQGQVSYQPPPQAPPPQYQQVYPQGPVQPTVTMMQARGQGLAEASAPMDGSNAVPATPKVSKLPEDHDSKPLIT